MKTSCKIYPVRPYACRGFPFETMGTLDCPEARKIIGEKWINRKMSSTYYQLGKVYYGNGQRKQASDAFKKALAFRAIYPSCLFYFFMSKAVAGDESESYNNERR